MPKLVTKEKILRNNSEKPEHMVQNLKLYYNKWRNFTDNQESSQVDAIHYNKKPVNKECEQLKMLIKCIKVSSNTTGGKRD